MALWLYGGKIKAEFIEFPCLFVLKAAPRNGDLSEIWADLGRTGALVRAVCGWKALLHGKSKKQGEE